MSGIVPAVVRKSSAVLRASTMPSTTRLAVTRIVRTVAFNQRGSLRQYGGRDAFSGIGIQTFRQYLGFQGRRPLMGQVPGYCLAVRALGDNLAVLSHEGTYPILYGMWPIPVGAAHRDGYIARPDEAGRFPVVFVIPGLAGLGSFEKDTCRRLARAGFAAVALDLYRRHDDPLAAYNDLTDARVMTDLDELHEFVVSSDVGWNLGNEVGVLGTDVGGRFALIAASKRHWVKAAAIAYAPLTGDEDRDHQVADYLGHLPIPVLGLYGGADDLIDPLSVDEAQRRNEHGQWLLYEGAAHGFLDVDDEGFDQGAADDAFARLIAFFGATMPSAEVEDLG